MYYIYTLLDPDTDEVRYVGVTKNLKMRFGNHLHAKTDDHRGHWVQSLLEKNKKPKMVAIEQVSNDEWQEREIYWIEYYRSLGCNLVNSAPGGIQSPSTIPEIARKISDALKGKPKSEEHCKKMSQVRKGVVPKRTEQQKQEHLERMTGNTYNVGNNHWFGRHHSEESNAKNSESHKGKKPSAKTIEKLRAFNTGRKHTKESIEKMRKPKSEQTKERMRHPKTTEHRERIRLALIAWAARKKAGKQKRLFP